MRFSYFAEISPRLNNSSLNAFISESLGKLPVNRSQRTPSGIGSPFGIVLGPFA
jgi:hypothetical protein